MALRVINCHDDFRKEELYLLYCFLVGNYVILVYVSMPVLRTKTSFCGWKLHYFYPFLADTNCTGLDSDVVTLHG